MNAPRTASILQRVPVILAVTAASYGLPAEINAQARTLRAGIRDSAEGPATDYPFEAATREALATHH
jgi:hypothetical protein